MILDKEVEIVVNSKKINHYKNFGYELKPGQKINVKIEHLSLGSKVLINVKCDVCGKEKKLTYNEYVDNTKKFTELYCCSRKCGEVKKEKTNLKIYGVKNVSQSEVVKQKKTETCLKNWGVEYPSQNIGIFEKQIQTCLKNNGYSFSLQNKELLEKINMLYGVKNVSQSEVVKKKRQKHV
jgi:hypothetical protein